VSEVLAFVEDPGAANCLVPLLPALAGRGIGARVFARGAALPYLAERGVAAEAGDAQAALGAARLVLVGTSEDPDTPAFALIRAARRAGVPSAGLVDQAGNAEWRFRGRTDDPLAHAPDWLLLPDAAARSAFLGLGFPAARALPVGHPHFDVVRARGRELAAMDRVALRRGLFPGADADRPLVTFLAERSEGLGGDRFRAGAGYGFAGSGEQDGRTEIVMEEVAAAARSLSPDAFLLLRLHPKTPAAEFGGLVGLFDAVSAGGDPLALVHAADLVVGMTSMLLLEAALLDRPTLSVLPRAEEAAWLPSTAAGLTPVATTRAALRALWPRALAGALRPERARVLDAFPEGGTRHAADAVSALLAGRNPRTEEAP
jgi:hypothetical protein